jgi:FkbM family methyltransferase
MKKVKHRKTTMNMKQFIPAIFISIYRTLTRQRKGKYEIGKYEIEIPPNFALPMYQNNNKLYDRFLPVLAKKLTCNKSIIIDVGANIGDTAIAVLQHCTNPIICIEPSDVFFPYLEKNLKKLTLNDFNRVKTFKKLVGTGLFSGNISHSVNGTASVNIADSSVSTTYNTHTALDELIEDSSNILLLKVDTDGFDFDVIKSAEKILSDSEPILFWENQISEDFQNKGFDELYSLLTIKGYKYIGYYLHKKPGVFLSFLGGIDMRTENGAESGVCGLLRAYLFSVSPLLYAQREWL